MSSSTVSGMATARRGIGESRLKPLLQMAGRA
jgi:hypothetical protein